MNFAKLVTEDMRLTILQVLAEDTDYSINEDILRSAMGLMGHKVSVDRLRTELSWLAEQGLVQVDDTVGIKVATLTARGLDVKDGAALVPGVKRPAPWSVKTMAQPSSIIRLPEDILEKLQELLRDPRVTQLDATAKINEILEAEGHEERVSKSAVNRYSLSMREAGEKLQQSREVAKMWIGKLGAAPQGQVGNLVNEILRTLAFDLSLKLQDEELTAESIPMVIKQLKGLALSVQRLEASSTMNVKRDAEIRKAALEKAASEVEETARAQGMDDEQAAFWRNKVLGVA